MKTSNSRTKAFAFWGAAFVLLIALMFTACPNNAGGETPYVQVPYGELRSYLKGASADKVNYIEVTGPIPKDDFKNTGAVSRLGNTINRYPRKVALKITYPSDLTDMGYCFYECTNLISLANLPASKITNMDSCFANCEELTSVPNIPADVENISSCFAGCKKLTTGPDIPASVTSMHMCFNGCTKLTRVRLKCDYSSATISGGRKAFADAFKDCIALTDGSIKVPAAYYDSYTDPAALTTMQVPGADTAAQKAKFAAYNP